MTTRPTPASAPHRVALVTGATGGLGHAVVRAFLDLGCALAATYREDAGAREVRALAGDQTLLPLKADATSAGDLESVVAQTVSQLGRLDYLVNLVGGWAGGTPVWETAPDQWDRMLAVNLTSAFAARRTAVPHVLAQRDGRIVTVSSRAAVQPSASWASSPSPRPSPASAAGTPP